MSDRRLLLLSLPLLLTTTGSLIAADQPDMPTTVTDEVVLMGGTAIYGDAVETGDLVWVKLPNQMVSFERGRVVRINRRVRATVSSSVPQAATALAGERDKGQAQAARRASSYRSSRDADSECALGLNLGTSLASNEVTLDLGGGLTATDDGQVGGLSLGLDAEWLSTSGTSGFLWGAGALVEQISSDRVDVLGAGLELRAGWRMPISGGWRLDSVAGFGVRWSRYDHAYELSGANTGTFESSGAGFGPSLRLEGRFGPAVKADVWSWALLAGVAWSTIDVEDDVSSGPLTGTTSESVSGIQPYLGFRVIFGS